MLSLKVRCIKRSGYYLRFHALWRISRLLQIRFASLHSHDILISTFCSQPYSQWWHCHCISSLFYFSIFKTYIKDKIWNLVMHLRQRREKRGNYRESTKTAGLFSKSRTGVSSSGRFQRQKAAAFVGTTYNLRQWPNKCQSLHKPSRSWLVSVKLLTLTAEMQQNDFMSL